MHPLRTAAVLSVFLPAAMLAATCGGHGTRESVFVSTQWLADHLKDRNLVMLAIGTDAKEFEEAHIPGSVFFNFRDSAEQRNGLTLELPSMDSLAATFSKAGVSNDSRIVIYYLKDWFTPAARVYMTLDAMGLGAQTSLLDGHFPAWKAENRAVATGPAPAPAPGKLTPCAQSDVIASLDYVKDHLHTSGVRVLDARDPKVYSGETARGSYAAGHIAGAGNVFYSALLDASGKIKPEAELRKLFTDAGVASGDRVVTYCFIGQQASALYTVSRYLGYDTRLYDGSMDEWSKHPELPVDNPAKK